MKHSINIFFFVAICCFIISCSPNPGNILISKNGNWTMTIVNTVDNVGTFTSVYNATFFEGSATLVDTGGLSFSFNWYYDKKAKQIKTSNYDGLNTTVNTYSVSNIEKDSEKWTFKSSSYNGITTPPIGYTSETTLTRN